MEGLITSVGGISTYGGAHNLCGGFFTYGGLFTYMKKSCICPCYGVICVYFVLRNVNSCHSTVDHVLQ